MFNICPLIYIYFFDVISKVFQVIGKILRIVYLQIIFKLTRRESYNNTS